MKKKRKNYVKNINVTKRKPRIDIDSNEKNINKKEIKIKK